MLGMGSANERWSYNVTSSLIGWAHNQDDSCTCINTLRPRQNGRHFADDMFKCIFMNENVWIPIRISLKFVPKVPINNIPALVQIMAWRRSGDKPLSQPMMDSLLMHICITPPQWVNTLWPGLNGRYVIDAILMVFSFKKKDRFLVYINRMIHSEIEMLVTMTVFSSQRTLKAAKHNSDSFNNDKGSHHDRISIHFEF